MYCSKCGSEMGDDATFCSKCGDKSGGMNRRKTVLLMSIALAVVLTGAGIAIGVSAASSKEPEVEVQETVAPEEEAAVEQAEVPDFVALGGESTFSLDDALNQLDESPRHYGDPAFEDEYLRIAKEAGLNIELVSWDEYEDAFGGGRAGWPVGQEPAPGELVAAGSTVTLIVVDEEDESVTSEPVETGAAPTITMETGESYCYVDSVQSVGGIDYVVVDYIEMGADLGMSEDYEIINNNSKLRTYELTDTSWLGAYWQARDLYGDQVMDSWAWGDKGGYPLERDDFKNLASQGTVNDHSFWFIKVADGRIESLYQTYQD